MTPAIISVLEIVSIVSINFIYIYLLHCESHRNPPLVVQDSWETKKFFNWNAFLSYYAVYLSNRKIDYLF